MPNTSFSVRIRGPLACFTRPEYKVERMSYPCVTPSAARGAFEAVLWKPAIQWHIDRIALLAPIQYTAFRRNEVNSRAIGPTSAVLAGGGAHTLYFADEDRAQRNTVALRDVDYRVDAHFTMTDRAGSDDNPVKFVEIFRRRLENGQHWQQPYLGCREFIADLSPVGADTPAPLELSQDLGVMLWDIVYNKQDNRAVFFAARLERGVIEVPPTVATAAATLGTAAAGGT